ncbi:MAG TPA: TetR family transcriptional regulator [Kofleriaceae bacterium]|nr:TetR family transcriptional regulator [Kofleriaceae bacterium]
MTIRDPADDILDVAAELAASGGYDEVRLRDVAARAGVALATLYKRFPSKEALLAADCARRSEALEVDVRARPPAGATERERLVEFFGRATHQMIDKPGYGRAVLRAMASGPESARHVVQHQGRMVGMVLACLRGVGALAPAELAVRPLTEREQVAAFLLLQIWFATLVGWSAGLSDAAGLDAQMARAIDVVLAGA